ncbi:MULTISPECIES: outer membrane beta-barrel family protein [unclassified Imperialibacter]|uniref:outer membrane beta-barrel family protein n=1 Tax=unclassified Imperialibacter TaxID=2629706 RepID=UPI001255B624|nr:MULTISPECIES: outer membrane beta-barrel family protein [unclassified Imperialibacter]CAD5257248.1 conserved exported hypothetical protein [Imperialibacter sp. 75]CAD5260120.1 conserved exported hypothetical protein [Imperialibacter sp. 89]VVT25765.1 conserved exported hypothetical protein [Imperialibacter sp. EC-SDR9]
MNYNSSAFYYRSIFSLFFLLALSTSTLFAQGGKKVNIKGKVVDSQSGEAMSFASIRVFGPDDQFVGGNVTDDKGNFTVEVPAGSYYALVEFMGYEAHRTGSFQASSNTDIGTVQLSASSSTLEEVEVRAEKSTMELSLDKKIFNVGQDLANAGGTASDLLTNIPSIAVDPEGNVKLRGSDNVMILIDGKPSGLVSLKGASGLQQMQASMVDKVEIITNPSARYQAEGMAGIINIVLKKDRNQGFNGSFQGITGYPYNFGGAANLNYRHKKINWFVNYGIAWRKQPNVASLYQEVYSGDTTFISRQDRDGHLKGFNNNIQGGLDFFFSEKSILTASYLFTRSDGNRITDLTYRDYLNDENNYLGYTARRQNENEAEPNSETTLTWEKSFEEKGHKLLTTLKYIDYWERSDQIFTQRSYDENNVAIDGSNQKQHALNDEFEKQYLLQLDYTKPIGKEGKFETGLRSSLRNMENNYVVTNVDEAGVETVDPDLKNIFLYDENIQAAYAILGNKSNKFTYQAGLRVEYTDVRTRLVETNEQNPRDYLNFFPSAHLTYAVANQNSFQLSYSRRIRRPFYNDLSPFVTLADGRNFFSGNPDLNPEYTDAYEIGHLKYFEKGSLTSSFYYRDSKETIDRIRVVDDQGNARTLPQNLIGQKSFGLEFTSDYNPYDWWKLDLNFNFFHAEIDGTNIIDTYKPTTYSWFARQTSRFTLPGNLDIQLRGNFEAPQKTTQGTRKALAYIDLSFAKEVLKGNGTLNLNIMDVFNSRVSRYTTNGPNFFTDGRSQFRRRQVNLTLNYRIRQSKSARRKYVIDEG